MHWEMTWTVQKYRLEEWGKNPIGVGAHLCAVEGGVARAVARTVARVVT